MKVIKDKELAKRIVEFSYKNKLIHIGSCLTAVGILDEIYRQKKTEDKVVLSQGHAGLALYVVLEKYLGYELHELWNRSGTHPIRNDYDGIDCSGGSLGCGLPIAVGMALADRAKDVFVLISDGELAEGSIWESLRLAEELKLTNLKVHLNMNGWSAYGKINMERVVKQLSGFVNEVPLTVHTTGCKWEFLQGLEGHYHVLDEDEYKTIMEDLND